MSDVALFFTALGFGCLLAPVYFLLSFLRKTGGIIGTVITDVVFAVLLFAPLILLAVLCTDGTITPYTVIGLMFGFFAFKTLLTALYNKAKNKLRKKRGKKIDEKAETEV